MQYSGFSFARTSATTQARFKFAAMVSRTRCNEMLILLASQDASQDVEDQPDLSTMSTIDVLLEAGSCHLAQAAVLPSGPIFKPPAQMAKASIAK